MWWQLKHYCQLPVEITNHKTQSYQNKQRQQHHQQQGENQEKTNDDNNGKQTIF